MRKRSGGLLALLLTAACLLSACGGPAGESSGSSPFSPSSSQNADNSDNSNCSDKSGDESVTESGCPDVSHSASSSGDSSSSNIPPSSNGSSNEESSGPGGSSDSSSGGTSSGISGSPSSNNSHSGSSAVSPPPATSRPNTTAKPTTKPTTPSTPEYQGPITIKTPVASGKIIHQGNGATVDASNTSDGYIMVKCVSSAPRLKVQIKFDGYTYNYDLNKNGNYEVFSLQGGSGEYTVRVMENISGTRYRQLYAVTLNVKISNAYSPYLYPNQYIDFSASSKAVKKSYDLCVGASTDLKKIEAIYSYITANIAYDYKKADDAIAGKLNGYLPDVDDTLKTGKGICFDYAALMAAMLRAQNIPVKLVIGTVSPKNLSHAWNLVYTKEKGWIAFKIYFSGGQWKLMDATFGAAEGQNIEDYIGDGGRYTQLRVY